MTQGLVFCLLYMKKNYPPLKNDPCLNIEKLNLKVLNKYVRFTYIEKASRSFDLIRRRDLPNTRVDLEFIVVLIMCFATVFSVGTEGFYLSIFCESQQLFNTVL